MYVNGNNAQGLTPLVVGQFSKGGIIERKFRRFMKPIRALWFLCVRRIFARHPRVKVLEIFIVELPNGKCTWATKQQVEGSVAVPRTNTMWGTTVKKILVGPYTVPRHWRFWLQHQGPENRATVANLRRLH